MNKDFVAAVKEKIHHSKYKDRYLDTPNSHTFISEA
jgi:hypothetical protein